MSVTVERDWTTRAGLRAVVLIQVGWHRCGYVAVLPEHPLHGKQYNERCACLRTLAAHVADGLTLVEPLPPRIEAQVGNFAQLFAAGRFERPVMGFVGGSLVGRVGHQGAYIFLRKRLRESSRPWSFGDSRSLIGYKPKNRNILVKGGGRSMSER